MADSDDVFDSIIGKNTSERPAFRQAPPGAYTAMIRSVTKTTSKKNNHGLKLDFTLIEALHDEDMTGVQLSKCRADTVLWLTEAALPYTQSTLRILNPDTNGKTIRDAMDILPGTELVVIVSHRTHDENGEEFKIPWLKIDNTYSVEWYNKKHAA